MHFLSSSHNSPMSLAVTARDAGFSGGNSAVAEATCLGEVIGVVMGVTEGALQSWWLISYGSIHIGDLCGIGNVKGTLTAMVVATRELKLG